MLTSRAAIQPGTLPPLIAAVTSSRRCRAGRSRWSARSGSSPRRRRRNHQRRRGRHLRSRSRSMVDVDVRRQLADDLVLLVAQGHRAAGVGVGDALVERRQPVASALISSTDDGRGDRCRAAPAGSGRRWRGIPAGLARANVGARRARRRRLRERAEAVEELVEPRVQRGVRRSRLDSTMPALRPAPLAVLRRSSPGTAGDRSDRGGGTRRAPRRRCRRSGARSSAPRGDAAR